MIWFGVLAVLSSIHSVYGILNSTSVFILEDGLSIYPCWQVNHREQELEPAMMGLWYVIEIIQHRDEPKHQGTKVSDICPKINLYKPKPSIIKLIWNEKAGDVHYSFKMTDPENSGFWIVWGKQTGSMLNKVYQQFAGSVQVIEAHPNRMVLMFCSNNRSHFSIIMVRNITVTHDTSDVHRTLSSYGLPEYGVRQTCRDVQMDPSSASLVIPPLAIILSPLFLHIFRLN